MLLEVFHPTALVCIAYRANALTSEALGGRSAIAANARRRAGCRTNWVSEANSCRSATGNNLLSPQELAGWRFSRN